VSRILWAGIGPGHDTGYGGQTKEFTRRLRDAGHDVVLSIMGFPATGQDGRPDRRSTMNHPAHAVIRDTGMWDGMRVTGPHPELEFGLAPRGDIWDAFGGHDPDLVIALKDAWVLNPADYRDYRSAVWLAFDCEPLGVPDRQFFAASGARAVCVSQAGQKMARAAGAEHGVEGLSEALYVPSGIDTGIWSPGDRDAARALLGLPRDRFIAGICAANIGPRKAWGEQLAAFAAFRRTHRDALLLIHATPEHPEGISLYELARHLGIREATLFGAHTAMDDAQMVNWMRSLNVLMGATYGEGFGLPVVQAQACGIPVIGTRCSAITEKIPPGTGWLVRGQRWWNPHHQAWWTIPSVREITLALGKAARGQHARPELIREHALAWDAATVAKDHWAPALEELLEG
jgi:glycosyltransferase involved in cell wall biosynthesis